MGAYNMYWTLTLWILICSVILITADLYSGELLFCYGLFIYPGLAWKVDLDCKDFSTPFLWVLRVSSEIDELCLAVIFSYILIWNVIKNLSKME